MPGQGRNSTPGNEKKSGLRARVEGSATEDSAIAGQADRPEVCLGRGHARHEDERRDRVVAIRTQAGLRYGYPQANRRSRCPKCSCRSMHDGIRTLHTREKENHQNAQNCQYSQVTSRAARNHSTYYIATLELPDPSGNVGAAAVPKPERLFTLILLALSYRVYLLRRREKSFRQVSAMSFRPRSSEGSYFRKSWS